MVRAPPGRRAGCFPAGSDRLRRAGAPTYVRGAWRGCHAAPRGAARRRHMSLIVQKYGGTSVGDVARIRNVARRVADCRRRGDDIVVVVSAMAGETNRLIA